MYQWQPGKWFQLAIVGVGLPFVAGAWLSTPSLVSDISTRAAAAIGGDWAKTEVSGRDIILSGDAGKQDAVDAALSAAAGVYGVRLVDASGLKVAAAPAPAPVVLSVPVINAAKFDSATAPVVTGTWDDAKAKTLEVGVNSKTYVLGKDSELSSATGAWSLKLPAALPVGSYDVTAIAGDGDKAKAAAVPGKLVVEAVAAVAEPLVKPTLVPSLENVAWPHPIVGTWPEGPAKSLSVGLAGTVYQLGKNAELTSDGKGQFTLQPPADLKPGTYDVDVKAADDKDQTISVNFPNAVVVPVPVAPGAPTVEVQTATTDRPTIKGTWSGVVGQKLQVELDGVIHNLGKTPDIASDDKGNWTLTPEKPLVNGIYDVIAKVTGVDGQSTVNAGKGALTIKVEAPQPAPAADQPYDCVATLAKISAVYPIHFEFGLTELSTEYRKHLQQYADLLNDPRCQAIKVQVAGHADYKGSAAFNQTLSENRAKVVVDQLTSAKVDSARLSPVGFGSSAPLDPAHSDDARAKNRRVEFSIQK